MPSKGKQCREESKTSLVGLRFYKLIGVWGVSCWLQRSGLKPFCWSQGEPAGVLLPGVMTDCAAPVTTASQESCTWSVWAEQRRKRRSLCLHLTQWEWWPWKQCLVSSGVLRITLRNTKPAVQALWVGKTLPKSLLPGLVRGFKPSSFMSSGVPLETAVKGLNWNSCQRRQKGKLWPSCCQILLWAGQDRGWTSTSDLPESTLCSRLSKSHFFALLQGGVTRWGSWAQTYLESQTLDLALTRSLFSRFTVWLSQLLPPQLVPEGSRSDSPTWGAGLDAQHTVDSSNQHCGKGLQHWK